MTAKKVGRNDPCPCGSGKKYKHCCLRKDQRRRRRRVAATPPSRAREPSGMLEEVRQLRQLVKEELPDAEARELHEDMDKLEEAARYTAMADEIDAATEALEAHQADFERMMADAASAMDRALRLFSEERFAHLRFSVDELKRTFDEVGYPASGPSGPSDKDMEILVAAAVHLAGDEEQRFRLTRRLLMTLPEYVAAGRYRDAWLIQYSAFRLMDVPEESNPFMFVMTELAFEAWGRRMNREQDALIEALGVDPATRHALDPGQARKLAEEMLRDPDKSARLERFAAEHPDLAAHLQARMRRQDAEAVKLLEHEGAECLLLSMEEVEPWMPVLADRAATLEAQMGDDLEAEGDPTPELREAGESTFVALATEMAREIYTEKRIDELVADLEGYRDRLKGAEEHEAAEWAESALMVAQRGAPVEQNMFLVGTCFVTLREVLRAIVAFAAADASSD
jgi:hypothetical protein